MVLRNSGTAVQRYMGTTVSKTITLVAGLGICSVYTVSTIILTRIQCNYCWCLHYILLYWLHQPVPGRTWCSTNGGARKKKTMRHFLRDVDMGEDTKTKYIIQAFYRFLLFKKSHPTTYVRWFVSHYDIMTWRGCVSFGRVLLVPGIYANVCAVCLSAFPFWTSLFLFFSLGPWGKGERGRT